MKRKQGEAIADIKLAISQIAESRDTFLFSELTALTNIKGGQLSPILKKLKVEGYIFGTSTRGYYKINKLSDLPDISEHKLVKEQHPLEIIVKSINDIPNLIYKLAESLVELMIEPELEIMNMIDRRNKRIMDLEILLNKTKIETSNSRAKISELTDKINKLYAEKNKVIPETKVVYRSPLQSNFPSKK